MDKKLIPWIVEIKTLFLFFGAGLLGIVTTLIILVGANSSEYFAAIIIFIGFIPVGLLSGFIAYLLEKLFNKILPIRVVYYFFAVIFSIVFFFLDRELCVYILC